jgi:hypothetical protein
MSDPHRARRLTGIDHQSLRPRAKPSPLEAALGVESPVGQPFHLTGIAAPGYRTVIPRFSGTAPALVTALLFFAVVPIPTPSSSGA